MLRTLISSVTEKNCLLSINNVNYRHPAVARRRKYLGANSILHLGHWRFEVGSLPCLFCWPIPTGPVTTHILSRVWVNGKGVVRIWSSSLKCNAFTVSKVKLILFKDRLLNSRQWTLADILPSLPIVVNVSFPVGQVNTSRNRKGWLCNELFWSNLELVSLYMCTHAQKETDTSRLIWTSKDEMSFGTRPRCVPQEYK